MANVAENRKFNTNFGKIKNNNTMKQIQRYNVALFNFCIDSVEVDTGTLSVDCTTISGDSVTVEVDLADEQAELPTILYNYSVGGTLEMFLSLVWRLYLDTPVDAGDAGDVVGDDSGSDAGSDNGNDNGNNSTDNTNTDNTDNTDNTTTNTDDTTTTTNTDGD